MAYKSIAEARNLSDEELTAEITSGKQKLFQLRLAQTTGRLEKPHEFKHTRRWVAQLLTIQTERQKGIVRKTTSNTQA
ncbi:50S ribosomal protein L29 [Cyanobacterium sp. Dongsha4]|uniref:50S ribosomal protein L29 n=1 Tax=Cyanobacterium sp. DS4 TaxID=2878255 RepID=UPI002E7FFF51|nr:50S ribosomal protein L29 [Cyanobacterium sp. Dongsha4]WVL02012.1 50S ribosomal protein L29 [Cyanobacterium sp. Dongsha4]